MTWDGVVRIPDRTLDALAARLGGRVASGGTMAPTRIVPVDRAGAGELAPLLSRRFLKAGREAAAQGAALLVDGALEAAMADAIGASDARAPNGIWLHPHAGWALAEVLDDAIVPAVAAEIGEGCSIAPSAVLGPRVVIGARVSIGAGAVIGHPGFGWAFRDEAAEQTQASASRAGAPQLRAVPQLGGVVIEDDVSIGPLSTIDAGTLSATRIRRGAKLDAHVHVGHNGDVGEGTLIAAQCGFAGSVTIGRGVLVGGQVGIADHVVVGDGARIAAKSGVIGDVPAGVTFAGYPAVARARWLRALAKLYRELGGVGAREP